MSVGTTSSRLTALKEWHCGAMPFDQRSLNSEGRALGMLHALLLG